MEVLIVIGIIVLAYLALSKNYLLLLFLQGTTLFLFLALLQLLLLPFFQLLLLSLLLLSLEAPPHPVVTIGIQPSNSGLDQLLNPLLAPEHKNPNGINTFHSSLLHHNL